MSNYSDGDFDTRYGTIHVRNPGPFEAYGNVQVYAQTASRFVRLQGPALRAFKAAEQRITPRYMKRKGKTRHILITGQGGRSYSLQMQLWLSEPGRFAHPDGSMHVEYDAVDVDQNQSYLRRRAIKKALVAEGWHYAISGEPWHASYRLSG